VSSVIGGSCCARAGALVQVDRREQQARGAGVHSADPDRARAAALRPRRGAEPVDRVQDVLHAAQQLTALDADPGARAPAVEERDPELTLELRDRLAQRGLRDVQVLARTPQGPELGDGGDVLELLDAHGPSWRGADISTAKSISTLDNRTR